MSSRSDRVLLVDDDAVVRGLVAMWLAQEGYRVVVAASGEEALEAASRVEHIDLLVTDVQMPGINGFELAKILRAWRPLRVVCMSGGARGNLVVLPDYDPGAVLLEKPFDRAALRAAVGGDPGAPMGVKSASLEECVNPSAASSACRRRCV